MHNALGDVHERERPPAGTGGADDREDGRQACGVDVVGLLHVEDDALAAAVHELEQMALEGGGGDDVEVALDGDEHAVGDDEHVTSCLGSVPWRFVAQDYSPLGEAARTVNPSPLFIFPHGI